MVLRKEPRKKLLHSENGIQEERAAKAKEHKTRCILLAGHLHIRINCGNAIEESLNRNAESIKYGSLLRKDSCPYTRPEASPGR